MPVCVTQGVGSREFEFGVHHHRLWGAVLTAHACLQAVSNSVGATSLTQSSVNTAATNPLTVNPGLPPAQVVPHSPPPPPPQTVRHSCLIAHGSVGYDGDTGTRRAGGMKPIHASNCAVGWFALDHCTPCSSCLLCACSEVRSALCNSCAVHEAYDIPYAR